jgi:hypothetical protein
MQATSRLLNVYITEAIYRAVSGLVGLVVTSASCPTIHK